MVVVVDENNTDAYEPPLPSPACITTQERDITRPAEGSGPKLLFFVCVERLCLTRPRVLVCLCASRSRAAVHKQANGLT